MLHGLDLVIGAGEFVALMGPSGSGKTTLLNLIGGLDQPSSGEIEVGGYPDRQALRRRTRQVARRPCRLRVPVLQPDARAQRAQECRTAVAADQLSAASATNATQSRCNWSGLDDRATHKPKELSGGQEQRVAIARAIVSDPQDPGLRRAHRRSRPQDRRRDPALLQQLNREFGKTIVMVTHDPKAAEYAHVHLHLDKGTLAEQAAERWL